MNKRTRNGQVGLLMLVIMGVVVALVMSIASRSLSDTVLSRQEKESSIAFSLAETGVENALALLTDNPSVNTESNLTNMQYKIALSTAYDMYVKELETAHLDMTGFVGSINISWTLKSDKNEDLACVSDVSMGSAAAIEVVAINQNTNSLSRSYFKSSSCNSIANGFTASLDGGDKYRSTISYAVPAGTTMLRVKPIYNGASLLISGVGMPKQQYKINSKAVGGDAQKEIEVKRGLEAPASVFDYSVFTSGTIVK